MKSPHTPTLCQYWLHKQKRTCKNKEKSHLKCSVHQKKNVFEKPDTCIVCYESLTKNDYPFECGHWIHIDCIYKSCKQECPVCRNPITLNSHQQSRFNKYKKKAEKEEEDEEDDDSIENIEYEINFQGINLIPFIQHMERDINSIEINITGDNLADITNSFQNYIQNIFDNYILTN